MPEPPKPKRPRFYIGMQELGQPELRYRATTRCIDATSEGSILVGRHKHEGGIHFPFSRSGERHGVLPGQRLRPDERKAKGVNDPVLTHEGFRLLNKHLGTISTGKGSLSYTHIGTTPAFLDGRRLKQNEAVELKHGASLTFVDPKKPLAYIVTDHNGDPRFTNPHDLHQHVIGTKRIV